VSDVALAARPGWFVEPVAAAQTTPSSWTERAFARPVPVDTGRLLYLLAGALITSGAIGGWVTTLSASDEIAHPGLLAIVSSIAAALGPGLIVLARRSPTAAQALFGPILCALAVMGPLLVTFGQLAVGPVSVVLVVLYTPIPIVAVYLFVRPLAILAIALQTLEFGLVVWLQPGYAFPAIAWLFLAAALATIGATFGALLTRAIDEAERLSRLQRFLSPQVAEAVLSAGSASTLEPHRRRIAVLFCDLRGFTRFTGVSEPEEVVDVLDEYYRVVGALLNEFGATVGGFSGDGIMAYLNDPVPCDDPAGRAVELALRMRAELDHLVSAWDRHGFHLSYGIGVTYGYATLGVVGFEGRNDYTPLGSVVNLAARLSDEAAAGEILLDERTLDAAGDRVAVESRVVSVKGFAEPMTVFLASAPT
jgi:class 3 adenylate cyclase